MRLVSRNKQRAGLKSKRQGQGFEKEFELLILQLGAYPLNLPQGMKVAKNKFGQYIPMMLRTPCDYVIFKNGKAMLVDCKHVEKGATYSYSKLTQHQLGAFSRVKRFGAPAGYVIRFNEFGRIVFFSFEQLDKLKPRESLKMDHGIALSDMIGLLN